MKHLHLVGQLLAGASALAFASAAAAQTAAPAPTNEVVVTGSRVISNGNNMPTPVTVVGVDQMEALAPGSVAVAIEELPSLAGSRTTTNNPGSGTTNSEAYTFNLRNLGYNRNLVLFDGNRVAPATYDQLVDGGLLPQMLLQRVDIVTGGTSAVYGSDAISGVINFVTDSKFNGLKLDVSGGVSQYGDDSKANAGIAVGTKLLNDRAHFEFSYQFINDPGIAYRTARPWTAMDWAMVSTYPGIATTQIGTTADPYHLITNARNAAYTFGGLISQGTGAATALNGMTFNQNGVLTPFNNGVNSGSTASTTGGTYYWQSGGDGAVDDGSLASAVQSNQIFGRFDYDVTDTIHSYVEGGSTTNHVVSYAPYNKLSNLVFSGQNGFLPAAYQNTGTFKLSEFMSDMPRVDTNSNQTQYFVIGDVDGRFSLGKFGDYTWDVHAQTTQTKSTTRNDENINNQNLDAALDAVTVTTANAGTTGLAVGSVVCHVALTNPGLYPGCAPLNAFGPTAASAAALAYITAPTQYTVTNGMNDISGSISGSPFKDWAGPVNMAVSGEWRRNTLTVASTATPSMLENCTGLALNCAATTSLYLDGTLANLPTVGNSVYELAYEVDAPLLKDVPFAQDVSLNGAFRYTNYQFGGGVNTWKVGLVWQVDDEVKLRAVRSKDIRAPNLYELFQPKTVTTNLNAQDLLTGVTGAATVISGGNPNLVPETADTSTAGFVYSPKWMPGRFTFSVDAYYIDIGQAIQSQSPLTGNAQTICYASGGTAAICAAIIRPGSQTNTAASNTATAYFNGVINVSDFKIYGADFEANEQLTVFDNPMTLRALVTYQPHSQTCIPGTPCTDSAGGAQVSLGGGPAWAQPKVRASLLASYKVGDFAFGLQERWRGPLLWAPGPSVVQVYAPSIGIGSQAYTDINLAYTLHHGTVGTSQLYMTIQNLFNISPQPFAGNGQLPNTGQYGGFPLGDDGIGRYFTLGIRFRH